ncbi:class I SAM-dependent methyltransferase [Desulfobacter vibrioformis]|uniref:class I SAM-dependent methyltransferase n=1 Tax=Desulfobacter vibrioformis TaxID=34031 RepID=UPI0005565726|nr:class I SAM-dependent methyltransferase [Desulfobacter vibrioformis]
MASVKEHYGQLLSDIYSWMSGGFDTGIRRNTEFFNKHGLAPTGSGVAVDLGAGCGFQSIPLAKAGYFVTAIDLDPKLIHELEGQSKGLGITTVQADLLDFDKTINSGAELIVCMTDTILHLESKEKVTSLFSKIFSALEPGGKFILTFRDLTYELTDTDRFLPVKSDENTIFTCFLEYEPDTVKVHDLVYQKIDGAWTLHKSFYRKLRLPPKWITEQLSQSGFKKTEESVENGCITIICAK